MNIQINKAKNRVEFRQQKWTRVKEAVSGIFRKEADVKAILFLIGIREKGYGRRKYKKEDKEALMNLAVCRLLSISGYFEFNGLDEEGMPVWEQKKAFPRMSIKEQEELLKAHIIEYFEEEQLIGQ